MADEGGGRLRSGGRLVVDALLAHGVRRIFGVPGESYLPILDALFDVGERLEFATCRHKHGAAMMAEAHGKLTGEPGVCLVTRGPGACNAAIGVLTAFQDSTPMLLLVGQVERRFLGREAFQEVDLAAMFRPLAKVAEQIERTADPERDGRRHALRPLRAAGTRGAGASRGCSGGSGSGRGRPAVARRGAAAGP